MAVITDTTTFDTFFTATIRAYDSELHKNFISNRPIVSIMMDDYGHTDERGGRLLQTSAEYGANQTVKFWAGADPFPQEVSQTALPIVYQWRYIGGAVTMAETEMLENSSQAALFDIASSRVRQVTRTMETVLGNEYFSDGTNYQGNTIIGLAAGVSTTPTVDPASGPVGGIPAATFSWWQNGAVTSAGSFAANGVKGTSTDVVLNTFNNCTDGMLRRPDHIVSAQDVWQFYNQTLLGTVRYLDPLTTKKGDLSWMSLQYQGIPWVWDRQCPAGRMYFLQRDSVHTKVDPRMKFRWSKPLTYPNQWAYTRLVGLRLVQCYFSRQFTAVIDGFTA